MSGAAQAIVVDMNASGHNRVPFNPSDQSGYYGVSLVPGSCSDLASSGTCGAPANASVPNVTSSGSCPDPALSSDLVLPDNGICSHGGEVMAQNQTFALTWDAQRRTGPARATTSSSSCATSPMEAAPSTHPMR